MSVGERALLRVAVAASALTGLAYWAMKYLMRPRDEFSVLGHPWQPHVLAAHVLAGPAVAFALGLIAREHILERVRNGGARAGWKTGLAILALAAPMVLSGYLLQIVTHPAGRRWLAMAHLVSGALFTLSFAAHAAVALVVRRTPARRRSPLDSTCAS